MSEKRRNERTKARFLKEHEKELANIKDEKKIFDTFYDSEDFTPCNVGINAAYGLLTVAFDILEDTYDKMKKYDVTPSLKNDYDALNQKFLHMSDKMLKCFNKTDHANFTQNWKILGNKVRQVNEQIAKAYFDNLLDISIKNEK